MDPVSSSSPADILGEGLGGSSGDFARAGGLPRPFFPALPFLGGMIQQYSRLQQGPLPLSVGLEMIQNVGNASQKPRVL